MPADLYFIYTPIVITCVIPLGLMCSLSVPLENPVKLTPFLQLQKEGFQTLSLDLFPFTLQLPYFS